MPITQFEKSLEPGPRLKTIRERMHFTQETLASVCDVSSHEISRIENGEALGMKRAKKLAAYLNVEWHELIEEAKG